jgi:hypothetical protein
MNIIPAFKFDTLAINHQYNLLLAHDRPSALAIALSALWCKQRFFDIV